MARVDQDWWDRYIPSLEDYQRQHGHCRIPRDYKDQELVRWVMMNLFHPEKMTPEQRLALELSGLDLVSIENNGNVVGGEGGGGECSSGSAFAMAADNSANDFAPAVGSPERDSEVWFDETIARLLQYQDIHGHCRIPSNYKDQDLLQRVRKIERMPRRDFSRSQELLLQCVGFFETSTASASKEDSLPPEEEPEDEANNATVENQSVSPNIHRRADARTQYAIQTRLQGGERERDALGFQPRRHQMYSASLPGTVQHTTENPPRHIVQQHLRDMQLEQSALRYELQEQNQAKVLERIHLTKEFQAQIEKEGSLRKVLHGQLKSAQQQFLNIDVERQQLDCKLRDKETAYTSLQQQQHTADKEHNTLRQRAELLHCQVQSHQRSLQNLKAGLRKAQAETRNGAATVESLQQEKHQIMVEQTHNRLVIQQHLRETELEQAALRYELEETRKVSLEAAAAASKSQRSQENDRRARAHLQEHSLEMTLEGSALRYELEEARHQQSMETAFGNKKEMPQNSTDNLYQHLQEMEFERSALRYELQEKSREMMEAKTVASKKYAQMEKEQDDLRSNRNEATESMLAARKKEQLLKQHVGDLELQKRALSYELLETREQKLFAAEARMSDLIEANSRMEHFLHQLVAKEQEEESIRNELDRIVQEAEAAMNGNQELTEAYQRLEERFQDILSARDLDQQAVAAAKGRALEAENNYQELVNVNEKLRNDLQSVDPRANDTADVALKKQEALNESLQKQLLEIERRATKAEKKASKAKSALLKTTTAHQEQAIENDKLQQELKVLGRRATKAEKITLEAKRTALKASTEHQKLVTENEKLQKQLKALERQAVIAEKEILEANGAYRAQVEAKAKLEAQLDEAARTKEILKTALKQSKERESSAKKEKDDHAATLQKFQIDMQRLSTERLQEKLRKAQEHSNLRLNVTWHIQEMEQVYSSIAVNDVQESGEFSQEARGGERREHGKDLIKNKLQQITQQAKASTNGFHELKGAYMELDGQFLEIQRERDDLRVQLRTSTEVAAKEMPKVHRENIAINQRGPLQPCLAQDKENNQPQEHQEQLNSKELGEPKTSLAARLKTVEFERDFLRNTLGVAESRGAEATKRQQELVLHVEELQRRLDLIRDSQNTTSQEEQGIEDGSASERKRKTSDGVVDTPEEGTPPEKKSRQSSKKQHEVEDGEIPEAFD